MHKGLIAVSALLLLSCNENTRKGIEEKKFFDITRFVEQTQNRLGGDSTYHFIKTVTVNGRTETKQLNRIDWKTDMDLFKLFDINKPSWQLSFSQTEEHLNGSYVIKLNAIDSLPQVKEVRLVKDGSGKIKEVFAMRHTKNLLYELFQEVHYFTDSLYLVKSNQKIRLLGNKEFYFETRFIR